MDLPPQPLGLTQARVEGISKEYAQNAILKEFPEDLSRLLNTADIIFTEGGEERQYESVTYLASTSKVLTMYVLFKELFRENFDLNESLDYFISI